LNGFALFAILATATGFAEMANKRYLKLPTAMGLVLISLGGVAVVFMLDAFGLDASEGVREILPTGKDFQDFFINSSLALMLYAAATSIDAGALRRHALPILFFATIGTLISVVLVAIGTYYIGIALNVPISPSIALLFGAIIAPTDPIAVSKVTEKIKGWRTWKAIVTGESLFNDAIALIIFTLVLNSILGQSNPESEHFLQMFLKEVLIAVGVGVGLVFVIGCFAFLMHSDSIEGRFMVGIGIAAGSYSLADAFGGSGPIAVVTAGLTTMWAMRNSPSMKPNPMVMNYWNVIEHCLASMFFLLIGFEVLTVDWKIAFVLLGVSAWAAVFFARVVTVTIGYASLAIILKLGSMFYFVMPVSLAGVRGALSVALALSLPMSLGTDTESRSMILAMTFGAVVIGIILQSSGLMATANMLNRHRSNRVRLRKPLRSVLVSARGKRRRRHHDS
jgi:CPA1 family monovalent cation:H+ antiporter